MEQEPWNIPVSQNRDGLIPSTLVAIKNKNKTYQKVNKMLISRYVK